MMYSNTDQDNIHRIRDELAQIGLIPSSTILLQNDGSSFSHNSPYFGDRIEYKSSINTLNDEAVVLFIGHEYSRLRVAKYFGLFILIFRILIPIFILLWLILWLVSWFTSFYWKLILGLWVLTFLMSQFSIWFEFKFDNSGAKILLDYGRTKGREVSPSKSLKELISECTVQDNSINKNENNKIITTVWRKFDNFLYPPNSERIKKLEKLEESIRTKTKNR